MWDEWEVKLETWLSIRSQRPSHYLDFIPMSMIAKAVSTPNGDIASSKEMQPVGPTL